MRPIVTASVACLALAAAGATAAGAANPFAVPRGQSLEGLAVTATAVSARQVGSTVRLDLHGVASRSHMTLVGRQGRRAIAGTGSLPHRWVGLLGFSPTVTLAYATGGTRRTHAFTGGALPRYISRGRVLRIQFPSTTRNLAVLARMAPSSARDVTATMSPTPAPGRLPAVGQRDPSARRGAAAAQASVSSTAPPTPFPPAHAGTSFTLPYTSELGGSGKPWDNYLTATGETVPLCQSYANPATTPGGISGTTGAIYVYQTSSQVQQALSIGGSVQYKRGLSKAKLSVSYSDEKSQSSSSMYAVSVVRYAAGTVSLGTPSLTTQYNTQAENIATAKDALVFMQSCGDSYPVSYGAGATYIAVMRIQLSSSSQAQSVSAKMKLSYAGQGASQSFSNDLTTQTSSAAINYSDECWGPTSTGDCTVVRGYAPVTTTDMTQALAQFNANYSTMLSGLPVACAPSAATPCVTEVTYQPISGLVGSYTGNNQIHQAAYGAFGVDQNLAAWDSEYQSLLTANPSSSSVASWTSSRDQLGTQAVNCGVDTLSSSACSTRFQSCANSSQNSYSYLNAQCLPAAFPAFGGMQDPFVIAGAPEEDLT